MIEKETFRTSVRDLIAAGNQEGDLSSAFVSQTRGVIGIREQIRLQALRPQGYEKEVGVSLRVDHDLFFLEIFGRIDGILVSEDRVLIEEIKTTPKDPALLCRNPIPAHTAQLKCYGHMVAAQRNLETIDLQLTYVHPLSQKTGEQTRTYTAQDLKIFFDHLVSVYIARIEGRTAWQKVRNQSIRSLGFPYEDFRIGQRELAEAVYKIVKNGKILFARAPTGTGKTIATLYPAVKSLGLGQIDKIFYLTAKTPGRTVAKKALKDLGEKGARLKSILLTAKQKICFSSDGICDMETCPHARDYYFKRNQALDEVVNHDIFDQALIETMGQTYQICPFELSLDISLLCDVIVCDLNYAFDPRVYLKRFFDRDEYKIAFLMDEAHNLPDRLRAMYSADLSRSDILNTQTLVREIAPDLSQALVAMHQALVRLNPDPDLNFKELTDLPQAYMEAIDTFVTRADLWLDRHPESPLRKELIDFYFQAHAFLTIAGYFDTRYRFFIERKQDHEIHTRLFCMDPSLIFSRLIQRGWAAILFSATFFPTAYYQALLFGTREPGTPEPEPNKFKTGEPEPGESGTGTPKAKNSLPPAILPYSIVLPSPFPRENFALLIHNRIQTTYRARERFLEEVAQVIALTVAAKKGNYMVYFPSYAYMNQVISLVDQEGKVPGIQVQAPAMTEADREAFLDQFTPESQITGFAVMGGIFGEGIDLEGKRLIGVMVVGVGLPQICPEQDQIRAYYEAQGEDGFFTAYQMPGFNRVMQAMGRLIRTETDQGVLVLMDERFTRKTYVDLFPDEWHPFQLVSQGRELKERLKAFWDR